MNSERDEREYGPWLDRFAALLRPGMRAMELGCGLGDDARWMADAGLRVLGLDRDLARVREAARRVPEAGFVVADLATGLPVRDTVVDVVVASLSLHYFDRRTTAAIVAEIARVLRDGGLLLARVNAAGDTRSLYGAGAEREPDVFEVEPTRQDNPLHRMPHIILSPHNASASSRFDPARKRRVGQELALTLQGKWPMSCVNPTVLEKSSLRRWQPYSMERGPNS